jgi:hypothetical protein
MFQYRPPPRQMHLPICARHLGDDVGKTRYLDSPLASKEIATTPHEQPGLMGFSQAKKPLSRPAIFQHWSPIKKEREWEGPKIPPA